MTLSADTIVNKLSRWIDPAHISREPELLDELSWDALSEGRIHPAHDPEVRVPLSESHGQGRGRGPQPITGGSGHDEHFIDPRTFQDIGWTEIITIAPLAVAIIWIGVYPSTIMDIMRPALEAILRPFGASGF